jgi:hypothetical protein
LTSSQKYLPDAYSKVWPDRGWSLQSPKGENKFLPRFVCWQIGSEDPIHHAAQFSKTTALLGAAEEISTLFQVRQPLGEKSPCCPFLMKRAAPGSFRTAHDTKGLHLSTDGPPAGSIGFQRFCALSQDCSFYLHHGQVSINEGQQAGARERQFRCPSRAGGDCNTTFTLAKGREQELLNSCEVVVFRAAASIERSVRCHCRPTPCP